MDEIDRLAELMGYSPFEANLSDGGTKKYFTIRTLSKEEETKAKEVIEKNVYYPVIGELIVQGGFDPYKKYTNNQEVEEKFLEMTGYKTIETKIGYQNGRTVRYKDSLKFRDQEIGGQGGNDLEAKCDAIISFLNDKNLLEK